MSWILSTGPLAYLVNVSGAADWVGDWVPCGNAGLLIFQVTWSADAGTAGVLRLDATQDPAKAAANIIPLTALTGFGAWPNVAATADTAAIFLRSPFAFVRLACTVAGGVANQFNGTKELRSG